jgi:hypothetical protein
MSVTSALLKALSNLPLIPYCIPHFHLIYKAFRTVAYLLKARNVKPAETTVARERLCKHASCYATGCNLQQWSNLEAVFCTLSVRQLRDATIEELVGKLFPMPSVPRLYNKKQLRLRESLETAVRGWCEMAASLGISWRNELRHSRRPVTTWIRKLRKLWRWKPLPGDSADLDDFVRAVVN